MTGFRKLLVGLIIFGATAAVANAHDGPRTLDRWPWAWGTECPFPWGTIEGDWTVESVGTPGAYHGHQLWIQVGTDRQAGIKTLTVEQIDSDGFLFAAGSGAADDEGRVITVTMAREGAPRSVYKIMVRSYLWNQVATEPQQSFVPDQATCGRKKKALAVTFCPMRGRKCMTDSNYLLK